MVAAKYEGECSPPAPSAPSSTGDKFASVEGEGCLPEGEGSWLADGSAGDSCIGASALAAPSLFSSSLVAAVSRL